MKKGEVLAVRGTNRTFNVTAVSEAPCKACGAFLIWAKTAKGKWIPLQAEPDKEGVYESHFAKCPNSKDFRKAE